MSHRSRPSLQPARFPSSSPSPLTRSGSVARVGLGLAAGLARPSGNATGINFLVAELVEKRLGLLHELVPSARRVAVLVNPANAATTEAIMRDVETAARAMALQIQTL